LVSRLGDVSVAVRQLLRRAVVQVSRFGELMEVHLLAEHADALEAVVALYPDARVLTFVSRVDALSVSLQGAHLLRCRSGARERDKARDCHVSRSREQLAFVEGRVGIPAAHKAAMGAALMRELAPPTLELGADENDASCASRRGADPGYPVTAAGVPECSAPAHSPTAEMSLSTAGSAAQNAPGRDRGAFDMGAGVREAPPMTTTADPTPNSGRAAPPGSETSGRHDVRGSGSVRAAARHCDRGDGGY